MIKIIGGRHKGKSLSVIKGNIVRPTSLIKREAIFNILMSHFLKTNNKKKFINKIILDAYAGTGALGLEALSRGSKFCYFIDKNKNVIKELKNNCKKILDINQYKILNIDFNDLELNEIVHKLDLIFLDPPYKYIINEKIFEKIFEKIKNSCIIIIENDKSKPLPKIQNMGIINEKKFDKTRISFMKKN